MCDVERSMSLEQMLGNQASFPVDLGYIELLGVPAVTSVSF